MELSGIIFIINSDIKSRKNILDLHVRKATRFLCKVELKNNFTKFYLSDVYLLASLKCFTIFTFYPELL